MKKRRIAPSEGMEQERMKGLVSEADPKIAKRSGLQYSTSQHLVDS